MFGLNLYIYIHTHTKIVFIAIISDNIQYNNKRLGRNNVYFIIL